MVGHTRCYLVLIICELVSACPVTVSHPVTVVTSVSYPATVVASVSTVFTASITISATASVASITSTNDDESSANVSSANGDYQIFYKNNDGYVCSIDAKSHTRIACLKSIIHNKDDSIPLQSLTLSHNGILLLVGTLADNVITRESHIAFNRGIVGGGGEMLCKKCKKTEVSPNFVMCNGCGWTDPNINAKGYGIDGREVGGFPFNDTTKKITRVTVNHPVTGALLDSDNIEAIKLIRNNALPKLFLIIASSEKEYKERFAKLVGSNKKKKTSRAEKYHEDKANGIQPRNGTYCFTPGCGVV